MIGIFRELNSNIGCCRSITKRKLNLYNLNRNNTADSIDIDINRYRGKIKSFHLQLVLVRKEPVSELV